MQRPPLPASVTVWLLSCCAMIFAMALLGAITRLTESGLSITRWDPVTGVLPPLSIEAWGQAFAAYQTTPQFRLLQSGMDLEGFKQIYFWEWLHRLWGRLISLAFALPLLVFWLRRVIDGRQALKFLAVFALGGAQGLIGWVMVESGLGGGLVERTSVSPIRLALHLGVAMLLYAILLWMALGGRQRTMVKTSLLWHGWAALACLVVTMTWGALTAGLQAGTIDNTWPLMEGDFLPGNAMMWLDPFANPVFVQFLHRWLGPFTMAVILAWVWRCYRVRPAVLWLGAMALVQVGLGLATLLSHAAIVIAVTHQAGAILLLTLLLYNLRSLCARPTGHR